mmetsp:Transcript_17786/g.49791  ORF Transcript_17786/g.49791 Transcript_17786/m.49791 type:complete len:242 (+) Transcript_17786:915-1640(+)
MGLSGRLGCHRVCQRGVRAEASTHSKGRVTEGLAGPCKGDHGVLEAAQGAFHQAVVLLVVGEERIPNGLLGQHLGVAQHHHAVLCAGQRNVEAPRVVEKPDALVLVGADARQDDVVLLATLEGVHAGDLNVLVQLLAEAAVAQHHVDDVHPLPLVGGDDTDLRRGHPSTQEPGHNLLHIGGLCAVEVGGTATADLLVPKLDVKHHRLGGNRPWEVDGGHSALVDGDTVLKTALIKCVGREL